MTYRTIQEINLITKDKLFNAIRDIINQLKKDGYEVWQIEEYLQFYFEESENYIYNQLKH